MMHLDRLLTDRPDLVLKKFVRERPAALVPAYGSAVDQQLKTTMQIHNEDAFLAIWNCDALIGHIKLTPVRAGEVEISYALKSEFQGNGYATAALASLNSYAREQGICLTARVHESNERSMNVLRRVGFKETGVCIAGVRYFKN